MDCISQHLQQYYCKTKPPTISVYNSKRVFPALTCAVGWGLARLGAVCAGLDARLQVWLGSASHISFSSGVNRLPGTYFHGGDRSQRGRPSHTRTFPIVACIMFTNITIGQSKSHGQTQHYGSRKRFSTSGQKGKDLKTGRDEKNQEQFCNPKSRLFFASTL